LSSAMDDIIRAPREGDFDLGVSITESIFFVSGRALAGTFAVAYMRLIPVVTRSSGVTKFACFAVAVVWL
jgi:hypothetical protein